jgi:hypothetical protein
MPCNTGDLVEVRIEAEDIFQSQPAHEYDVVAIRKTQGSGAVKLEHSVIMALAREDDAGQINDRQHGPSNIGPGQFVAALEREHRLEDTVSEVRTARSPRSMRAMIAVAWGDSVG